MLCMKVFFNENNLNIFGTHNKLFNLRKFIHKTTDWYFKEVETQQKNILVLIQRNLTNNIKKRLIFIKK